MGKQEKEIYRNELANSQMTIKEAKLPVIVIIEGWAAAGKGSVLGGLIKYMDPRFFKVYNMDVKSEDDSRHPFLYRYAVKMPKAGQFTFYDGSYCDELTKLYVEDKISEKEFSRRIQEINDYERSLRDNGYLVLKFFLDIDKKTQSKRIEKLLSSKDTKWRVTDADIKQNAKYGKYRKAFMKFLSETDTGVAPWYEIYADDKDDTERFLANTITSRIEAAVKNPWVPAIPETETVDISLKDYPLDDKVFPEDKYKETLDALQKELKKLHNKLYRKRIPVIIAYEGWDAAGKGGNIKRIASALDPRGYEVFPIASPTDEEKNRHFLWRFWNRLPRSGHVAVFDRTWYGRVMVERIEGFCSENDWKRAYREINEFEKSLVDDGALIIKFWVQIDKDTQFERFTLRQNTPEKQWKITDEDWRNREKWDQYESAIDEMLQKTSTDYAPWFVLESNDKKYARIKALRILIDEIERRLDED